MRKIVSLCLMLVMSMMIWADRTLYFVPNSDWTQANAKFAVYCFENEESEWSDFMTLVAGETNVYTTTIPDSYTQVIFCRMNSAATECNWGSKWNQSADITLPTDGKDMFTMADGWDQMSGTWSNYAAPQQQDTTNVSPLADKHFYLNGDFINWDTQKALEFTLADSLFTLTVDTLSGIFKVMTARNWEAPDYGGDYGVNLTLGVPYTLVERGYDLSCSTIYLNAELQLRLVGNDVILTLAAGTPVQQDTTGTNPQDTTEVAMITYYAVNSPRWPMPYAYVWKGESDAYKPWPGETMTRTGENFRGYEVYSYTMPKEYTMMIINNGKGGDNNQTPDMQLDTTLRYMYDLQWYASLDSIPAEQQDTTGTNPQDTTSVTPEVEHYYLIGAFNEWNVETALEFFNLDSFYTLKTASLEGEFKILTARSWDATNYGAANVGDQLVPGDEYELNSNSAPNLSVSGAYTNVILTLTKANDILKLYFAAGTPVQQDTTGTNPQDTTIVPPVVDETYHIKNNWNGGEWTWQPMVAVESVNEDTTILLWGYTDVFGGTGVNINTAASDQDALWFAVESFQLADGSLVPQAMDTVLFIYNNEANTLTATVIGRPSEEPQPQEEAHYYMVGQFNEWDVATAPEFAMQDSIYTITIDTMAGDFKIVGARDWAHGEYGAAAQGDVIDLGGTYTLVTPGAPNLSVNGTYTNATFKLAKTGVNLVLYFAAGTPVQQDTTGTNPQDTTIVPPVVDETYYIKNNWNGGEWTWQPMVAVESVNEDTTILLWGYTDVFGGTGVNINTAASDQDALWFAVESFQLADGSLVPQAMDTVLFIYNNEANMLTATVIGRPSEEPQPQEEAHYYMVGSFNEWTVAEAPEFTLQDSIYTITIDTMAGEFKIVGARDWAHGDYGASAQGDVINFGEAYTLVSSNSKNLSVNGTYTNATFKLAKNGDNLVLYFAAGTPVQQDTTGTNPQDTTIVPPVEEAHYYMVGSFNEWTVAEAPEFTLQDSIYTITIDTMAGEFKIVGARDWAHGDYGASAQGDVINFGEAYTLVSSNSKNLSVNGTYTNATFKLAKNGDNLVLYFAAGTPVQQDTTGTNPQDTTIVPPVVDTHYYIKNNWNGGDWMWQTMTRWERMNNIYEYTGVFGGTGVNINTAASDQDALWFAVESFQLADGSLVPQAMDTVLFIYNNEANTLTATVIGRPSVEPQPQEETHYYMVGQFNNWDVATAPEFTLQDSIYTITIDTMAGDFKIVGARDWTHGEYGAAAQGDVIDLGGTYTLVTPGAPNLSVNGTYTNATFKLAKNGVNLVLYFAAGTPVQQDTTGTNPQDTTIVPPVVNDITVYTVMPEGWDALNAYIWIGNQGYVTWPGEAMTNTGETFRGDTVYSYTFPETYTSIIFNNGNGEQTIDLTIDTTKLYYYGETWYASWDEVPEEVIILPATYYVSGNENLVTAAGLSPDYAWNAAAIKATSDTLVLNLRANTDYKLRLTLNGTWVSDVKNYYYLTEVTPGLTTDLEANICFTPAEDGPVTIIYNDSVFTVQGNFIVFAKPTYYIKNNWEAGTDWTWQQMDAIDNDSIYWGYVGVFGGTGVNIATEVSDDAPSTWFDVSSFIVEEGDLIPQPLDTVYFVFDALRETLTAAVINRPGGVEPQPQPETHFYLVGQFNGWDLETAPEFARQDSFAYTMTVDTLFGAMKVVVSRDSWEGNYGVADMNDAVLTIGQTKALVPYLSGISDNYDFSVEGIILNAVLNIVVTDNVVNITLVSGTPYVTPAENRHFYMTGAFNDWNVETALEFVYADSVYTLTIDTIYGEFKVTDARDWLHGIYGAYNIGDVLNLGNEYAMAAMNSQNLNFSQTYTNVTLNLRVENNVVTIIFVSGTPVPTTGLDTTVGNTATPVKLIENGALIILRDGVKYNAAGQRIR